MAGQAILIVEDEGDLRELLAIVCRRAGYQVLTATDGRAGLDTLRANSVDLVVSDIRMPIMDGFALLQEIRTGLKLTLPVILLTGFSHTDEKEAMALGATAVLHKPCTPQTILRKIAELLP